MRWGDLRARGVVDFDFFSITTQRMGESTKGESVSIDEDYDVLKSGESG